MSKIYIIDTNVLMRYLLKDDLGQFLVVEPYFMNMDNALYLPIQTLCEAVWIMKKKLKLPNDYIVQILEGLLSKSNINFDIEVVNFAIPFLKENGDFADGVIAYHTQKFDNTILLTFDKKLQKLCTHFEISHIPLTKEK